MRKQKKNILITGNTSGIGLELNKIFIKNFNIFGLSKSKSKIQNKLDLKVNFKNLKQLKKKIEKTKLPKNFEYIILNAAILGRIDLCNKLTLNEFENIFKINVLANKVIIDQILKKKIKVKSVIGISSGAANKAKDGWSLYTCSKSAFLHLLNTYAEENKSIKFINCAPGIAKTKMQDQIYNVKIKKIKSILRFKEMYDNNQMSSPNEIAQKIVKSIKNFKKVKSGSFVDLRYF